MIPVELKLIDIKPIDFFVSGWIDKTLVVAEARLDPDAFYRSPGGFDGLVNTDDLDVFLSVRKDVQVLD